MDFKDYYKVLGVEPGADAKAIKSVYRKLARQHHPDVNPGDKSSVEKFKEINEAYQVLSDSEQRKKYDEMRAQYERWQQQGGRPQDFNWQQQGGPQPAGGARSGYASAEDLEDMFGADSPFSDFFQSNFSGARGGQRDSTPRPRRGRDIEYEVEVGLEEAFHGAKRLLQIGERRIEATIPRGVQSGSRIRLAAQGEPGRGGGPAGDLYLVTEVLPHPNFEREGDDLYTDVPVDFYTAALGGEVRVTTLDGAVMLKVEAQTQAGRSIRLRGKGMPDLANPSRRGDLYARISLALPELLSEHELKTLRELRAAREKT
jgi:curved DNA-binding protein